MNAEQKLNEAKYFLKQTGITSNDSEEFSYNLSAFLSAARSVTWCLQKEFSKHPKFADWYNRKQEEMRHDKLMNFFNKKRNFVLKEKLPDLRRGTKVSTNLLPSLLFTDSVTIKISEPEGSTKVEKIEYTPSGNKKKTTIPFQKVYFFEEFSDRNVIELCEEHIKRLESIINKWGKEIEKQAV